MKRDLSTMVFPVENYTDKIHFAMKMMFSSRPWLSFTIQQMKEHLQKGYNWLKELDERQSQLLNKLIKTGIQKQIQLGNVKKVSSSVSVDGQWQWAVTVKDSGYKNVTSDDDVAQSEEAKKAINRRAIGGRSLWKLNGQAKLGQLH